MLPQSLDELHQRAQSAVARVSGGQSFAASTVLVADLPMNGKGRQVTGHFRAFEPGIVRGLAHSRGLRRRLLLFWIALGRRYRAGQITLESGYAEALSTLWRGVGDRRAIPDHFMHALATLIHEQFHAVSQGWSWIVQDRLLDFPAVAEFGEGIIELGIEEFMPRIVDLIGLPGLGKAIVRLDSRRAYRSQREAARSLVDHSAGLLSSSRADVLKNLLGNGGRLIALRTLAHDIAQHTAQKNRLSEAQWHLARFRHALPTCAESAILSELLAPFAPLAERAA